MLKRTKTRPRGLWAHFGAFWGRPQKLVGNTQYHQLFLPTYGASSSGRVFTVCVFYIFSARFARLRGLTALPLPQPAKAGTSETDEAGTSATTDGSP